MFDLAAETLVLLALAAFLAGFIDAIAGGGSLIAIPALLLAGLPPLDVLGTNKLQGLFGAGSATVAYAQKGVLDARGQMRWAAVACLASAAGAFAAALTPAGVLATLMPILLVSIALYFVLKPDMGDIDRARRLSPFLFGATLVPLIGFYDGLFGPGTGSFFMLAFVTLAGYGVLKATAHTKLLNFASNVGGFAVFALAGAVWWKVGLMMGACQFVGARLGSALAVRVGARLIKPLLIAVSVAMALRLLWAADHPLRLLIGF